MSKPAYSLVELLIVISIVGIFILLGTSAYSSASKRQAIKTAAEQIISAMQTAQKNALIGQKSCSGALAGYLVSYTSGTSTLNIVDQCESGNGTPQIINIPNITFMTTNSLLFRPLGEGVNIGSGEDTISLVFRHQEDNNDYQINIDKSGTIKYQGNL